MNSRESIMIVVIIVIIVMLGAIHSIYRTISPYSIARIRPVPLS